jgi:hypothetical protein
MVISTGTMFCRDGQAESMKELRELFEEKYQQLIAFCELGEVALLSSNDACVDSPIFQDIVNLGPDVVPLILDKLRSDTAAHVLIHALPKLTKKKFSDAEIQAAMQKYGAPLGNQGFAKMWLKWWDNEHRKNNRN